MFHECNHREVQCIHRKLGPEYPVRLGCNVKCPIEDDPPIRVNWEPFEKLTEFELEAIYRTLSGNPDGQMAFNIKLHQWAYEFCEWYRGRGN